MAGQLSALFPTDAKRYKEIAQDAVKHAAAERASFAARPVGLLW